MAWTTPKTDWATGELVTAEDMNAVGENLAVLGNLAKASYLTTARYERYTNDYVDIDSDNLNLTITTTGGMCWCISMAMRTLPAVTPSPPSSLLMLMGPDTRECP